ncbi:DUF3632 domain-containing protein [Aspergillus chevalieri]|uniref:Uncharacterized protein n=1 Tax=Aspergillus chevalieri TaxID=182096 RepID=A0A7R7VSY4_ASPCH|nr:uncharacterized protein ACHE_60123S [Aspergillus chevalieri]BCR90237.1 hypothetical protein ACHE_60123S [Aspergillus chevalieri]
MALSLYLDDDDPWIIEQQIFDILNDYLQPKSNITAAAAAQSIDNLFPVNRQDDEEKEDPGSFLWHLWGRFHRTAQQIPHAHPAQDKLAALIKCLRSFPSRTPVVYLSSWDAEYKLWEDLPLLGPTFQEEWDVIGLTDQEECQRNRNLNAYAARIFRDGSANLELFAIRALAAALEGRAVYRHAHTTAPQIEASFTPGLELDSLVSIAADWVAHCGEILLALSRKGVSSSGDHGGPLREKEQGFSLERWGLWKERFAEISRTAHINEETKRLAQGTRRLMDELEKSC